MSDGANVVRIGALYEVWSSAEVELPQGKDESVIRDITVKYGKGSVYFTGDDTEVVEFDLSDPSDSHDFKRPELITTDGGWQSDATRYELIEALKGLRNAIWDLEGWEQLEGLKEAVKAANAAIDPNFEES